MGVSAQPIGAVVQASPLGVFTEHMGPSDVLTDTGGSSSSLPHAEVLPPSGMRPRRAPAVCFVDTVWDDQLASPGSPHLAIVASVPRHARTGLGVWGSVAGIFDRD